MYKIKTKWSYVLFLIYSTSYKISFTSSFRYISWSRTCVWQDWNKYLDMRVCILSCWNVYFVYTWPECVKRKGKHARYCPLMTCIASWKQLWHRTRKPGNATDIKMLAQRICFWFICTTKKWHETTQIQNLKFHHII